MSRNEADLTPEAEVFSLLAKLDTLAGVQKTKTFGQIFSAEGSVPTFFLTEDQIQTLEKKQKERKRAAGETVSDASIAAELLKEAIATEKQKLLEQGDPKEQVEEYANTDLSEELKELIEIREQLALYISFKEAMGAAEMAQEKTETYLALEALAREMDTFQIPGKDLAAFKGACQNFSAKAGAIRKALGEPGDMYPREPEPRLVQQPLPEPVPERDPEAEQKAREKRAAEQRAAKQRLAAAAIAKQRAKESLKRFRARLAKTRKKAGEGNDLYIPTAPTSAPNLQSRGRTDSTDSHRRSGAGAGAGAGAGTSDTPEARTRRTIARANLFAAIKKIAKALNAENYAGNQQLLWELMWRCRGKDVQVEYANYLREAKAIPFDKAKIIVNNFRLPSKFADHTIEGPEALCKDAESLLRKLEATPEVELHFNAGDAHQHKATPQQPLPEPVRRAQKPKTAGEARKPKATGDVRKPKTAGDARKPKTAGEVRKPKATGDARKPKTAGDARKPKTAGEVRKPKTAGEAHKPKATGEVRKPKATGEVRKPKTTGEVRKPKTTGEARKPKTAGDARKPKTAGEARKPKTAGDARKPKTAGEVRKPKATKKKATTRVSTTASNPRVGSSSKALLQQLENQYGATHLRAVYNIAKAGRAQARRATHYHNCGYAAVPASDITGHDTFSAFPQHYQRFHATFNGVPGTGPMVSALAALSATKDALRNLQVARHLNTQALSKSLHTKAKPHSKPKDKPHRKPKAKPHSKPKSTPKAKPAKAKTATRSFWSWVPGHSAKKARKANRQVIAAAKQMERPTVRPNEFKGKPDKVNTKEKGQTKGSRQSSMEYFSMGSPTEDSSRRSHDRDASPTDWRRNQPSPDDRSRGKKPRSVATKETWQRTAQRLKPKAKATKSTESAAKQKESTKQPSRWQSIASAWPGRSAKKAGAANRQVIAAAKAMEMEERSQVQEPASHTVQSKMATFCVSTTAEPKRPKTAGWRRKKPSSWSDPLSNPDKERHTSRPCPQDPIMSRADENSKMSEEGRRQLMKARLAHLEGRATAVSPRL
jgi:hypothetical protein